MVHIRLSVNNYYLTKIKIYLTKFGCIGFYDFLFVLIPCYKIKFAGDNLNKKSKP